MRSSNEPALAIIRKLFRQLMPILFDTGADAASSSVCGTVCGPSGDDAAEVR